MQYLSGPPFEPLARASFLDKTKKALFLLAMATAKRVSELQALSFSVSFQVRTWYCTTTRSSVLRRSLLPILFPVQSLFRLFRTLLVTCPRGSSALSELLSSFGKLQGQLLTFRRDCSSPHGIWNVPCRRMPCHSTFDSALLTAVPCLPHVHPRLMTFVALPHLSITTVISLCPTLCRLLRGSRTVFSLSGTLRRSLPHRIISGSLALWSLLGIGCIPGPHSTSNRL